MAAKRPVPELTQTELARYSGRDPETVRKALAKEPAIRPLRQDGRSFWYAAPVALERILCGTDGLDFTAERARLAKEQADAQALKNLLARGEQVPASDQDMAVIALSTAASARLQAVPSKTAVELAAEGTPDGCQAIVAREIHAALHDLADAGQKAADRVAADEAKPRARSRSDAAAAEAERSRVGGSAEGSPAG